MKTFTDIITKYINNELSESDKARFEKELAGNAELKKEYELQLQLIEGVKRMGLKNQVSLSFKKTKTNKLIKKAVIGLAVAITVAGAVLITKNVINKPANNILYELNEQGNKNWAEADRALEAQVFTLNPLRDTIIETQKGIVISVPAGSFLNRFGEIPEGPIDLEVKEAMTPSDIMKAGLSTMSNGKLLETGGMFYINARDGEENLSINQSKPLNANVPVNNTKKDMMLFKGERKADGSINWIDPIPMRKRLTTVEITGLDFYPEHFLDSLKEMGFDVKNKKLTDSIYYSFSGYCNFNTPIAPDFDNEEGGEYSFDEAMVHNEGGNRRPQISPGEKLFRQNCAVCHTMTDQKLTGPGLTGLLGRIPGGDWLKRYILNNEKMIKEGDSYATKIYNENGKAAMTVFEGQLNENDMNSLVKYITGKEAWNTSDLYDGSEGCAEINPARIKAIWDKQFNHTILATKEFEERLKVIFKTCDAGILNLYIKNLNQDLYVIDSMVANRLGGELKSKFLEFYSRRDGCVDISDKQSQKLQKYFDEKRAVYAKAVNKALEKMYSEENKKAKKASEEYAKHMNNESLRSSKVFTEELQLNMKEAYRQLGKEKPVAPPPGNYLSAPITQTGWNNVDKYVIESTANRSTLDYTDPQTGKKAVIRYAPISIIVSNVKDYDKVMSYMIPDKLSSFQLMKKEGNLFKENLNELMKYSVVTVGFKGNSAYYHTIENAKAQAYTIELASIKQGDLDKKLNGSFGLNDDTDFAKEINYQLFETKEAARKLKIKQREEIQRRLTPVVFPCSQPVAASDTTKYDEGLK